MSMALNNHFLKSVYDVVNGKIQNLPSVKEDSLFHYTSLSTVFSILNTAHSYAKNGEVQKSDLWAFHSAYMNDPFDGLELYNSVCSLIFSVIKNNLNDLNEVYRLNKIMASSGVSVVDDDSASVMRKDIKLSSENLLKLLMVFKNMINNFGGNLSAGGTYIMSFSTLEKKDDLESWRTYSDDGRGVCLEFDLPQFSNNITPSYQFKFHYCEYVAKSELNNISIDIFDAIISDIRNSDDEFLIDDATFYSFRLMNKILEISSIYKNESYKSEKEVRFIFNGVYYRDEVNFILNNNTIKPYIPFNFYISAIKSITLGPNCDLRNINSLESFIYKLYGKGGFTISGEGFAIVPKVLSSTIKYRGK
jgi:hypothetical protein